MFFKKFHGRVEHSSFEKLTTKVAREQKSKKNSTLLVRKSSQLSNKLVQIKIHSCSFSQLAAQISPKLKKSYLSEKRGLVGGFVLELWGFSEVKI